MAGLLASGHYTMPAHENESAEPEVISWDRGPSWKEEGFLRRFPSHVAEEAMFLLRELEQRIDADSEERALAEGNKPE